MASIVVKANLNSPDTRTSRSWTVDMWCCKGNSIRQRLSSFLLESVFRVPGKAFYPGSPAPSHSVCQWSFYPNSVEWLIRFSYHFVLVYPWSETHQYAAHREILAPLFDRLSTMEWVMAYVIEVLMILKQWRSQRSSLSCSAWHGQNLHH